jgi:hypothetical protein
MRCLQHTAHAASTQGTLMTNATEHTNLSTNTSHRVYGSLLRLIGLLLALALAAPVTAEAQSATADWTQVDLGVPAGRLFTPSSGAFFAQAGAGLMRSDDAGATWTPVSLPNASRVLAIDPTNHQVLYVAGEDGVYRSRDDAASWSRILAYGPTVGFDVLTLAVSPADPSVLYLGLAGKTPASGDLWFHRSKDGGTTWELIEEHHYSLCGFSFSLLRAHPTDPNLVYGAYGCLAGRNFALDLTRSRDQGKTWGDWSWGSPEGKLPDRSGEIGDACYRYGGYPTRVVGGQGAAPAVFYLGVNRDNRLGGSFVVRTGDDGATSTILLDLRGGGSPGFARCGDPAAVSTLIGGLTYDPNQPDHIFVGFSGVPSLDSIDAHGSVLASLDGGASWQSVGCEDVGPVHDLALGIDGRNLYASSDTGVWRLALGDLTDPNNLPTC